MRALPTEDEIRELHQKYAPNADAFNRIYTHCHIVWDIAKQLIDTVHPDVDVELVKAGCLLHDIGAYPLTHDGWFDVDRYITHGIVGDEILKDEGFDEALCRIASHHTGVGLSKADIIDEKLPLPAEDFFAETLEEELVMYADKFHSKNPQFNTYESYKITLSKFGADKVVQFEALAAKFGIPDVAQLAAIYKHPVV